MSEQEKPITWHDVALAIMGDKTHLERMGLLHIYDELLDIQDHIILHSDWGVELLDKVRRYGRQLDRNYGDEFQFYNYRTGEHDFRYTPCTDDEAVQYIPQGAGENLYAVLRADYHMGVIEAMRYVLELEVSIVPDKPHLET